MNKKICDYGVWDETGELKVVGLFEPGVETYIGSTYFKKNLFANKFNIFKGREEHFFFKRVLEREGVQVIDFRNILANNLKPINESFNNIINRIKKIYPECNKNTVEKLIMHDIEKYGEEKALALIKKLCFNKSKMKFNYPLANMYFMRDQSNFLGNNVIISNMKFYQRKPEVKIIEYCLKTIGINKKFIHIRNPAVFEGGDCMIKDNTLYIGSGMRTNVDGIKQITKSVGDMFENVFGLKTPKEYDKIMNFMHLDTFINIVDGGLVTINKNLADKCIIYDMKKNYTKVGTLLNYIKDHGYDIISIPEVEQMNWAANFLTLKPNVVMAPSLYNKNTHKLLEEYSVKVIDLDLPQLSQGAGGAHCMALPIKRN